MTPLIGILVVALVGSGAVGPLARWALGAMKPSRAVKLTAFAALSAAVGTGVALSSLAVGYLAGWAPVAREGHLSVNTLHRLAPIPGWLGLSVAAAVAVLLARAAVRVALIARSLHRAQVLCRSLPGRDAVTFVDGADVFAVAGLTGRILVGRQLFEQLSAVDRRVVLTHEESHLRRRHHLYVHAVDIAAAANPLLRAVRNVVRLGIERWADEDAAEVVADREAAARALARVALCRQELRQPSSRALPAFAMAAAARQVGTRVQALLTPRPAEHRGRTVVVAGTFAIVLLLSVAGMAHVHDVIEAAQAAIFRR